MKRLGWALAGLLCVIEACSSSDNPVIPPADNDAGGVSDASSPQETSTPEDAAAPSDATIDSPKDATPTDCNAITDVGPQINYVATTDPAPASAAGGTIVDGTYTLTSVVAYGSTTAASFPIGSLTLVLSGSTAQVAEHAANSNTRSTQTGTFTTSGTDFTLTTTCSTNKADAGGPRTTGYTATATTFATLTVSGQITVVASYTKQ